MSRSAVQHCKVRAGGVAFATRVLVLALCFSLGFPLNLIGDAMQASARTSDVDGTGYVLQRLNSARTSDVDGTGYVLQRLNSAERKAAIEEARRMDAAAREAFARNEALGNAQDGLPRQASGLPRNDKSGITAQATDNVIPAKAGIQSSASMTDRKALDPRLREGDGARNSLASSSSRPLTYSPSDSSVLSLRGAERRGNPSSARPRTMTEVMFNSVTGFMGMPGLANQHDPYAPYAPSLGGAARRGSGFEGQGGANRALPGSHMLPQLAWNEDQGLGFHADGTARRADGTTGSNAASSTFDGRRAASYAGSGLGYGAGGMRGGMGDMNGYYGPGYDPTTGNNFRYGDSTSAAYHARGNGSGGAWGDQIFSDPQSYFMQRGLNYGMGLANSAAEGLFLGFMESPYGGAKARLNFMMDIDGRINGEGDVLLPFYDNKYTTVFTQLGARSMSGMSGGGSDGRGADRWIGNFGLGQRWFMGFRDSSAARTAAAPQGSDAKQAQDRALGRSGASDGESPAGSGGEPMFMVGYNVFFDNDFTRSHQRGGVGIEAQYDWMHLASNYYMPLSGWKGSKDFDSNFVKERAAEGWDIRAKGYLPFYRNVALTGAYTQWKGDHVGMFSSRKLEKDPSVWSYGMEYTPIPLVSGFVNQRSTEQGRSDTEFGLRMTYTFSMPWDQQTSHAKVAETRTVGGSRHEFVDRENRIILEYKAKDNYHVEFVGRSGDVFTFRIKHAFDGYAAGKTVRVSATGVTTLAEAKTAPTTFLAQAGEFLGDLFSVSSAHAADLYQTYVTDRNGEFRVTITGLLASSTVTAQAGNSTRVFTAAELGGSTTPTTGLALAVVYNRSSFVTSDFSATATITASLTENGTPKPINAGDITWTVVSSSITAAWWGNRSGGAMNGLTWGATPLSLSGTDAQRTTMVGTVPTGDTAQLTDIVGSRAVTLRASMNINSQPYTQDIQVQFGLGPLSVFANKPVGTGKNWTDAGEECGSAGNLSITGHQLATKLPRKEQLQAVAGSGSGGKQGAAHAAGWQDDANGGGWFLYWTGEAVGGGINARIVFLDDGFDGWHFASYTIPVTVCLP